MTNENRLGHTHNFLEKFRLHLIIVQRESQFQRCHSLSTFPPKKRQNSMGNYLFSMACPNQQIHKPSKLLIWNKICTTNIGTQKHIWAPNVSWLDQWITQQVSWYATNYYTEVTMIKRLWVSHYSLFIITIFPMVLHSYSLEKSSFLHFVPLVFRGKGHMQWRDLKL